MGSIVCKTNHAAFFPLDFVSPSLCQNGFIFFSSYTSRSKLYISIRRQWQQQWKLSGDYNGHETRAFKWRHGLKRLQLSPDSRFRLQVSSFISLSLSLLPALALETGLMVHWRAYYDAKHSTKTLFIFTTQFISLEEQSEEKPP